MKFASAVEDLFTCRVRRDDIASRLVFSSRAFSLALAALVALVPLVPAEHAHESDEGDQVRIVVHQHAEPHAIAHSHRTQHPNRNLDHPDEPVFTVSTVFTASAHQTLAVPILSVIAVIEPLRIAIGFVSAGFVEPIIHGPPRAPSGLRAPPAFPA